MLGVTTIQERTVPEDAGFYLSISIPEQTFPNQTEAPYRRNSFLTILNHKQAQYLNVQGYLLNEARPFISGLIPQGTMPHNVLCRGGNRRERSMFLEIINA